MPRPRTRRLGDPRSRTAAIRSGVRPLLVAALAAALLVPPQLTGTAGASAAPERISVSAPGDRARVFPTGATTGVPLGWRPARVVRGDLVVDRPGQRVSDVQVVGGDVIVDAPDVVLERIEVLGGVITNARGDGCQNGLRIKRSTVRRAPGQSTDGDEPAIGVGGYTARRVEILGLPEGFRVGGAASGCGPVKIVRSYARITSPDECGDWHGDALQGYDGPHLIVRDSVLALKEKRGCGGTAPFFYPADQGNTSVDIDGLVVWGGGYPFRLGTAGSVRGLRVVRGSWFYGPLEVDCGRLSAWEARTVDLVAKQPVAGKPLSCG